MFWTTPVPFALIHYFFQIFIVRFSSFAYSRDFLSSFILNSLLELVRVSQLNLFFASLFNVDIFLVKIFIFLIDVLSDSTSLSHLQIIYRANFVALDSSRVTSPNCEWSISSRRLSASRRQSLPHCTPSYGRFVQFMYASPDTSFPPLLFRNLQHEACKLSVV